jgi:hypothetical protein
VEIDWSRRVACSGDAYSIVWFRLERGDDGTKHYRKMKRRQRACLGSMARKCDMARPCNDVGQSRGSTREGKREETMLVGLTRILLGQKMKKIHAVNLAGTNRR